MKTILLSTYYQLLTFIRVKKAVFFTFFFPLFIFVVFSMVWGYNNPDYLKFLMSGVLIMTVASDALYTVGSVIMNYFHTGLVKFFKASPYSFFRHILALILSRLIIILFASSIVLIISVLFFDLSIGAKELGYIYAGILAGFVLFSFMGLLISISFKDKSDDMSIINFVYFVMIFLSDTFYPLTELNPVVGKVVKISPISPVLELTRGSTSGIWILLFWMFIFIGLFVLLFNKKQLKR